MKHSIKIKTTLLVAVIIVALIGGLLAATFFLAEPFMIHRQKAALQTLYRTLESGYSDDAEQLGQLTAGYEEARSVQVEIFDQRGKLIYTSGRKMAEGFDGFPQPDRPVGSHQPQQNMALYAADPTVRRMERGNGELLTLHGILDTPQGTRYVSLESPVAAISATVKVLYRLILLIAAVIALAGCGAAYWYAARFSRPIVAVSETAKRVADLDFAHCAEEHSTTAEIADLAVSINRMSAQLSSFISQLMEKNRRLEEDNRRLAKAEESRRAFVANVSHDLKSPLAVLMGYAEMLKEQTKGIDPQACYDVILEESATMDQMIRSMLDVSALENGIKDLHLEELDLSQWLLELTRREMPLLENKGLTVEVELAPHCRALADPAYLERAVMNYLRNAEAHTPAGGRIAITLTLHQQGPLLTVYNDGQPIPTQQLPKLWESFYKGDEARTRNPQNNVGLGLYIVKTIVEAHGGSCGAYNTETGVAFWLRLNEGIL